MRKRSLVGLLIVGVLAACGHHGPVTGKVMSKHIDPAHIEDETVQTGSICVPSGKTVICTPIMGTERIHVPDRFYVTLRVCKQDNGKCHNANRQVAEDSYRQAREGDTVTA